MLSQKLGQIPEEWDVVPLGSLAVSAVDGPFGSNLKTEHYVVSDGVRVVRLQNIGAGRYEDEDKAFISINHAAKLQRHNVRAGDLLIAALGDEKHLLARACLYPMDHPDGIVKTDCFRFRLMRDRASNGYVMSVLNSRAVRPQIEALGQGVTRDRVNLTKVKSIVIGLPSIREQNAIYSVLETQEQMLAQWQEQLFKLRRLKTGLMQDLLTGKVSIEPLLAAEEATAR
jgi:type I restriction enzyme, S subunit